MEGRVCLQVRIPYALSGLKIWKCFSFGIVSLAVVYFGCRLEGFVVFVQKRSVLACFGLRCLFFCTFAMPICKQNWFRGAAGQDSGRCPAFFLFWLYVGAIYAESVFRAGPDFLEVFFLKRC